jgi:hypothetical protein
VIDIVERLRFDSARCELQFSKGVAGNIDEAVDEIERLRRVILRCIRDDNECRPAPGRCTGWDAKQCGCAEEARNAYEAQL